MSSAMTNRARRGPSSGFPRAILLFGLLGVVLLQPASLGSASVGAAGVGLTAGEPYSVIVYDQHGAPAQGARATVRDGATRTLIGRVEADRNGVAQFTLDRRFWYLVDVGRQDGVSFEMWWYGYILIQDWSPSPSKVVRRSEPWLEEVRLPANPWPLGAPRTLEAVVQHAYPDTSYQFHVRVWMGVDADGQPPYDYEAVSDYQNWYDGPLEPFQFVYTPTVAGRYSVRFLVERRFVDVDGPRPWVISDEGGWGWTFDAGDPTPTATPSPSPTPSPTATDTPSPTPTATPPASPTPTACACTLSGSVYLDLDHDGALGDGDVPLSGARVLLSENGGGQVAQRLTEDGGAYVFSELPCGAYVVRLGDLPTGFRHLAQLAALPSYHVICAGGRDLGGLDWPFPVWRASVPLILQR
ncbi:MAG: hypothetical protein FJZ90_17035 [Chloroflexi bacterium]|nr:hypothetical protein [Chloroflexota bacterium]